MERIDVPDRFLQILPEERVQGPQGVVPELPGDLQILKVHTIELPGHFPQGAVPVTADPAQDVSDALRQLGFIRRAAVQESGPFAGRELRQRLADGEVHGMGLRV
jgi:hypothetical protein